MTTANPPAEGAEYTPFNEAAALNAVRDYDPFRLAKTGPKIEGPRYRTNLKPMMVTRAAVASEHHREIGEALAGVPPERLAQAEHDATMRVVERLAAASNVARGHPNGNARDKEIAGILHEQDELEAEQHRILAELADVRGYETVRGPDGSPQAVGIPRLDEQSQKQRRWRLGQIAQRLQGLSEGGIESERRIRDAEQRELATQRQRHEEAQHVQRTKSRAAQIVRDRRVEQAAETQARWQTGE